MPAAPIAIVPYQAPVGRLWGWRPASSRQAHPEDEAVDEEDALEAGNDRLGLQPPRRGRHGSVGRTDDRQTPRTNLQRCTDASGRSPAGPSAGTNRALPETAEQRRAPSSRGRSLLSPAHPFPNIHETSRTLPTDQPRPLCGTGSEDPDWLLQGSALGNDATWSSVCEQVARGFA